MLFQFVAERALLRHFPRANRRVERIEPPERDSIAATALDAAYPGVRLGHQCPQRRGEVVGDNVSE